MPEPEPVSVRDLEVADRIARAVRGGRPADRTPTLEQVVAAFGEAEPNADARRRAARALALAGVATVPDLLEATPGQRVTLEVRHVRRRRALLLGVLALIALFAAAAALATQVDFGDDNTAADLPADTTTTATAPAPTGTTATATTTTDTTSTAAAPATSAERRRAKRARERRAREARARQRRARRTKARAAARRRVTVRLTARLPTFLCVEGDGKQVFNGTLSGSRTFSGRVVRLNIGLGPSTRVTANGKAVPLTASPTGIELTPKKRTFLPLGARPCA
jgi:New glue protein family